MATSEFHEEQKFDSIWQWIIFPIGMVFIAFDVIIAVSQAKEHRLTTGIILVIVISMLTMGFVLILFRKMKLTTRINEMGVYYKFSPFHNKERVIVWNKVNKAYVRTYSAIKEYGGWGIRYAISRAGKAYNVKGNQGLQLVLNNKKKILFGTQKPDEQRQVIADLEAKGIIKSNGGGDHDYRRD